MKIAQVCPYDIHRAGGVQRHILDLSASLRKLGHDMTIIAPRVSGIDPSRVASEPDAVPIVYVGHGKLIALNKTVLEITLAWGEQRTKLRQLLQTGGFDVVHFHTPMSPFLPLQALRCSTSANVSTFHAVVPDTATGVLQRGANRLFSHSLAPRLDAVIFASDVQKNLELAGIVLPPCTDLRRFGQATQPIEEFRDDRVNILFLGRLELRKGAIVLLESYMELCRRGLPVRLLIAGDGPERARLEAFARQNHLRDVAFLGAIRDADIPRWYATCDIFCAPSPYGEGFGIVLTEAMASGRPIVAADNAGYRTVLRGEAARFLVKPGDAGALRSGLEALVVDQAMRERLGAWGAMEARRYDSDETAPEFVRVYEAALSAKSRRNG